MRSTLLLFTLIVLTTQASTYSLDSIEVVVKTGLNVFGNNNFDDVIGKLGLILKSGEEDKPIYLSLDSSFKYKPDTEYRFKVTSRFLVDEILDEATIKWVPKSYTGSPITVDYVYLSDGTSEKTYFFDLEEPIFSAIGYRQD